MQKRSFWNIRFRIIPMNASARPCHLNYPVNSPTLDGPVIADARIALESGEPPPVRKWVLPKSEHEICEVFAKLLQRAPSGRK